MVIILKPPTRVIRYTGENIDDNDNNPYEIEYYVFAPKQENEETFMVATLQGTITSTVGNCPRYKTCLQLSLGTTIL